MQKKSEIKVIEGNTKPLSQTSRRAKHWCFTSYDLEKPFFDKEQMSYLCYSLEQCPDTQRNHWQSYVEFYIQKTLKTIKSQISTTYHFEEALGSPLQNKNYCAGLCDKKNNLLNPTFEEHGSISKGQGARSDLHAIAEMIEKKATYKEIIAKFPVEGFKFSKGIKEVMNTLKPKVENYTPCSVEYWHGTPGTGKTRAAYEQYPDLYSFEYSNGLWWDGYEDQETILFDEFESQIPIFSMLKYTDVWPCRLQIKCSTTEKRWKKVIIISNKPLDEQYTSASNREAFLRRIEKVITF